MEESYMFTILVDVITFEHISGLKHRDMTINSQGLIPKQFYTESI